MQCRGDFGINVFNPTVSLMCAKWAEVESLCVFEIYLLRMPCLSLPHQVCNRIGKFDNANALVSTCMDYCNMI